MENSNQEIKKIKKEIAKLEQIIGKMTIENYILKREKEYIIQQKNEDSSIITCNYLNSSKKDVD